MRGKGGVWVAAVLLLLTSIPAFAMPSPPPGPFVPHGIIFISGDANFTAANGVVAGSGSPGDPFVISGWSFVSSGTAIRIHNVTKAFIVANNSFDAGIGVQITQATSVGLIFNNQFLIRSTGISITSSDAIIVDNSFIGSFATGGSARGVDMLNSNSRVETNTFVYVQYAVRAERGSPRILCNDMHDDVIIAGVSLLYTANARVECNTFTRCHAAVSSVSAFGTVIVNNTITNCRFGITVLLTKDADIRNNTVRFSMDTQVKLDMTSGNFTNNVIIDGQAGGIIVLRSPILFANNTISNHLGVGVVFAETTADVYANVVSNNSIGISLQSGSVPHLVANVMVNNTIGIDLPYSSRQAIVNMSANIVNGVNIDGTLVASEKVFFYHQANVTITGQVRDSGFSAGYYGSLTAQGGIVLWEVDTANVNATLVSHHRVGIGIVSSFNVNVNGSLLLTNLIGVQAQVLFAPGPVPACVVSVKDTNITIPVDPVATIGIDLQGCLGIVGNVTVSVVDYGIRVDGTAGLTLFNTTVSQTKLALDVQGKPNMVNLTGNLLIDNVAGARLSGTVGVVANNTFLDNDLYGVRLENSADITLTGNNFTQNGQGLVDGEACLGPLSCSKVTARANTFLENRGDGARVNGTTTWRGDVALGNQGSGFVLGSTATLRSVRAAGNEGDGARIVGSFDVQDSVFTGNEQDGLDITGNGQLKDSNFTFNEVSGIRITSTFVSALRINASFNFDGILASGAGANGLGVPNNLPQTLALVGNGANGPDPFDVHLSSFIGNQRDAMRVGAALVNATHNYWGKTTGPSVSLGDTVGAFQNGVSPAVRFVPFYADPARTTTGPVAGL